MIAIFTVLNTLGIIYLILKNLKLYVNIKKHETAFNHTLLGYHITLWKRTGHFDSSSIYSLYIPLKNAKKVELQEEILRMINYSDQNRLQTLSAKFSWLKTLKAVEQFEKDYLVVDRKIVERLVSEFKQKQK